MRRCLVADGLYEQILSKHGCTIGARARMCCGPLPSPVFVRFWCLHSFWPADLSQLHRPRAMLAHPVLPWGGRGIVGGHANSSSFCITICAVRFLVAALNARPLPTLAICSFHLPPFVPCPALQRCRVCSLLSFFVCPSRFCCTPFKDEPSTGHSVVAEAAGPALSTDAHGP